MQEGEGLNTHLSDQARASMGREVAALQALATHPHIVPLRGIVFSRARGMTVGVALEFIPGGDLSGMLE